jgi:DNA-binding MarR family transcriptional regulator
VLIESLLAVDILEYAKNCTGRNMSRQLLTKQSSQAIAVWVHLLRAHASATRELSAKLLAEHGLTINDYEALLHLSRADKGALRRVDLAGELVLTPSGVTRLLDGLEQAGLVCKGTCESDARVTYAVLTDAGRARLEEASCSHVAAVSQLFGERFDDDELEALASLLGRLPGADGDAEDCTAGQRRDSDE